MDCIFCKIVKGEMPGYKVAENEHFLAILDIYPQKAGHVLIIPKVHCKDLLDIDEISAREFLPFAQKVAGAVAAVTGGCFNLLQNNGADAGQVVFHFHAHIIPRHKGDGLLLSKHSFTQPTQEEFAEMAAKIRDEIK